MPIDPNRVQSVFLAAVQQPAGSRALFLDQECGCDAELRQRVETLLQAHDEPGSFLESRPAAFAPTIDMPGEPPIGEKLGTQIGPYKLLQQIGEGGMGTVYMAEQTHPVQRKVALKVIKAGMDSREVIARFEAERQALALMDHPNIARVFDGGATEAGRPYFVMELVRGVPITDYCDQNNLPVHERLELFVTVCHAVQHAHQKGIIHRDIKPSNVLITLHDGRPVSKVIDFGVAKAIGQQLTDKTLFTQFAQMVGTPLYMSPEQAELTGLDVDTRGDIYSLGVLLYELLTGTTPFEGGRMKKAALDEIRRMIREEDPPSPSMRLSSTAGEAQTAVAAHRRVDPRGLSRLVRGDLDWIVMKALEKDRSRRYETANGFAADIGRYLSDEPVKACPPSAVYRFRKFARRNKRALVSAALLGVMVLLGVVLLVVNNVQIKQEQTRTDAQKTRAEKALGEAKENLELADENLDLALQALDEVYMVEIEKRVIQNRQLTPADREFLQKGLRFYEQFGKRNSTSTGLQGATAKANRRAGYLRLELAQWQEAVVHFRKAVSLLEKLAAESPNAVEVRRELASTRHGLAVGLRHTGPLNDAETTCRLAIGSWQQLVDEFPAQSDYRVQLGHSLWQLQDIVSMTGSHQEAEKAVREALKLYEELTAEFPKDLYYRQETALSHRHLAESLQHQGRLPEAVQNFQRAVVLYAGLVADSSDNLFLRYELAYTYAFLGHALKDSRRTQEAEDAYRQAVNLHEKLVQDAPKVADYRKRLAWYQNDLANLLLETKRFPEAELCRRRALDLYKELAAEARAEPEYWYGIARQSHALAQGIPAAGRPGEVKHAYEQAVEAYRQAVPLYQKRAADSPTAANRRQLADCQGWLGEALRLAAQPEEAIKVWREARSNWEKLVQESNLLENCWLLATRLEQLGDLYKVLGRHQEAETVYRDSLDVWKKLVADYNRPEDRSSLARTESHLADARLDAKLASYRKAIELDPNSASAHTDYARALRDEGRRDQAIAAYRTAIDIDPKNALTVWRELVADYNQPGDRRLLGICYEQAAELHKKAGQLQESEKSCSEALAEFEKLVAEFPDTADYRWHLAHNHYELGFLLRDTGKLAEAVQAHREALVHWEKLATDYPSNTDYLTHLGNCAADLANLLQQGGRQEEARQAYRQSLAAREQLLGLFPENPDQLNNVAWFLATHPAADADFRDAPRAVELADKAVKLAPGMAIYWNTLGVACYRAGHYQRTLETLEKSARMGSHLGCDAFFLAMAHWQLGSEERAKKWYAAALAWTDEYAPQNEDLIRFRAEAAVLLELTNESTSSNPRSPNDKVEIWSLILEADPTFPSAWAHRGDAFANSKAWDKADADFAKAVEFQPDAARIWYLRAICRLGSGDLAGYCGQCAAMVKQFALTEKSDTANWAAWTCTLAPSAVDEWVPALQLAEKAIRIDPKNGGYLCTKGALLYRAGRFSEAVQRLEELSATWEQATTKPPTYSPAYNWFFLAMAHRRQGNEEEARRWLDKAVKWAEQEMQNEVPWNRRLTVELLRREAEALLKPEEK